MSSRMDELVARMRRNPEGTRFSEALKVAEHFFGPPRIRGSHRRFDMPWAGDPMVNLQPNGSMAKPYQVRQLVRSVDVLRGEEAMMKNPLSYRVFFSEEDNEWVGVCDQFNSLSHLDKTPVAALAGIKKLVDWCIDDLRAEGRPMPWEVTSTLSRESVA